MESNSANLHSYTSGDLEIILKYLFKLQNYCLNTNWLKSLIKLSTDR